MTNPSKNKGTFNEKRVREYLRAEGFPYAERRALNGSTDLGDITGVHPGLVIEVKAVKGVRTCRTDWLDEVDAEMRNAGAEVGVCFWKKDGASDPADWWVSMRQPSWAVLFPVTGVGDPEIAFTVDGRTFVWLLRRWAL